MIGLLRRFPGYTLTTLLAEDAELLQLLAIAERGRTAEGNQGYAEDWEEVNGFE